MTKPLIRKPQPVVVGNQTIQMKPLGLKDFPNAMLLQTVGKEIESGKISEETYTSIVDLLDSVMPEYAKDDITEIKFEILMELINKLFEISNLDNVANKPVSKS